jgi:hypothetical protein
VAAFPEALQGVRVGNLSGKSSGSTYGNEHAVYGELPLLCA